jgi:hypothetical protein
MTNAMTRECSRVGCNEPCSLTRRAGPDRPGQWLMEQPIRAGDKGHASKVPNEH